MRNKVIVVVGPTAVGKTALGIQICQKFNGEVISGDSQQVYRTLDIGTAKATEAEQKAAIHHLIDVRDIDENFSAHDFVSSANHLIKEIQDKGKLAVIVGGTGLYIQSLIEGYHLGGQERHDEMLQLRAKLSLMTDDELFKLVADKSIEIQEINRRRAIRALELEAFGEGENQGSEFDFLLIGLNAERSILYNRINQRVDLMTEKGLLEEAKRLFDNHKDAQAAKAIGYKEFFPYFRNEMSLEEAIELVKRNSRRYAKRQLTWFKNRMNVNFYDVFSDSYPQNVTEQVTKFLEE